MEITPMNCRMKSRFLKLILFWWMCCSALAAAQYPIPEKPKILWPVHDEVGLLTAQEKNQLNDKLIKFEKDTSVEIEVIIIPTTQGEDVNFLATMYGEQWGIGKKKIDNGIVFLIATEDHSMSIQQGRAVEQYLTASVAGQILDYLVTPYFKKSEWYQGIDQGTSAIMDAVKGEFKPLKNNEKSNSKNHFFTILLVLIFMLLIFFLSSKNNDGFGGNDDGDVIISRRGRRLYPGGFFPFPMGGSGFGGGSSGGGFGGFGGGGSFGGGGASGGW